MTASHSVRSVLATTDVHSALGASASFLGHLHEARSDSLLVDCGDFFEGTGYVQRFPARGPHRRPVTLPGPRATNTLSDVRAIPCCSA
ncbi:hypothetical protein ACFV2Q_03805 [Streptomyces sp. NPDC059650]|uniref:hypothetical protein n=1 Tax=Streptomyces sp. NPDC059650 TaxID=3346896 RepID=UPI0036C6BAE1